MNHLPYTDWLVADGNDASDQLNNEQQAALQSHLENCLECRSLATSWQSIEGELRAAPLLSPSPGFSARWQARLAADRERSYRRQGIATLSFSLGIGIVLIAVLVFLAWPLIHNPGLLVWTFLYQLARWYSILGTTQQLLASALPSARLVYLPIVWMFAAVFIGFLIGLWVISYRFFVNPRSVLNEYKNHYNP